MNHYRWNFAVQNKVRETVKSFQCLSFKQAELVASIAELQFEFLSRLAAHFNIFKIVIYHNITTLYHNTKSKGVGV